MRKTITTILVVLLLAAAMLSGCAKSPATQETPAPSTGTEEATPAVDEPIALNIAVLGLTNFRPTCSEMWMWQKYEEMTNVHVEWNEIPESSIAEQRAILLSSDDMPDAFYQCRFTTDELIRYGEMGQLVPLDDLIAEHAPNLSALMAKDPSIAKALKMPDGHIYSLPYLESSQVWGSLRYYINQKWLDELDIPAPKTLDELTAALKRFKTDDPNGNGENDEIPIYMPATSFAMFEQQLLGSFGLGNRGHQALVNWIDMGTDGKVRFIPTTDAYKEILQYESSLWQDGLIYENTFTDADNANWNAAGAAGTVGLFSWVSPGFIGDQVKDDYTGINALVGPHGDKLQSWCDPFVRSIDAFVITKNNPHPAETMEWVDYFYSEEGSNFATLGLEGETYVMENGKPRYIDEIMNDERGIQLGSYQYVMCVFAGGYPYLEPDVNLRAEVKGMTVADDIKCDPADLANFTLPEYWGAFSPTADEASEISRILTDMNTYINEARPKFLSGEYNFTTDWDQFVSDLETIGSERYIEIRQQQYERYSAE